MLRYFPRALRTGNGVVIVSPLLKRNVTGTVAPCRMADVGLTHIR